MNALLYVYVYMQCHVKVRCIILYTCTSLNREAICSLKYRLVQNAIDTQKPLSVIAEWKMRDIPTVFDTPLHSTQDDNLVKSCDNKDTNTTSHIMPVPESSQETETNDEATCNSQEVTTSGLIDIKHIRYNTGMSKDEMMEPPEISEARGELAILVGEKQRMEARERRLERRLSESENQLAELQVVSHYVLMIFTIMFSNSHYDLVVT